MTTDSKEFNSDDIILNVIKSPIDNRDWLIGNKLNIVVPQLLDYRYLLQPIRDQGSQGTCYAQSAACAKEWQENKDYGFNNYLSPQFFYNHRPNVYDEHDNNDYGMFGRDVMRLLSNIGICTEDEYPYGKIENKNEINVSITESALKHKIKSYARIDSIDTLKLSLYKNGPCLIAFPIYNYSDQMWSKNNEDDKLIGGHAMTVVGYTKDSFIIRNSWGKYWGEKGYCYYKFKDWGAHWEIWSIVDDKTIIIKPNIVPDIDIDLNSQQEEKTKNCFITIIIMFFYSLFNVFKK